jgi:16S rRNA processing protein RimM
LVNPPRDNREQQSAEGDDRFVTLGRVSGLYGVRGWVKVHSDTDPRENIVKYTPWYIDRGRGWETCELDGGRAHGKSVVAKLKGCDDRDAAAEWIGASIAVRRDQLASQLVEGEFYWTDLEGLEVETTEGVVLGRIDHLFETGANDVMVVKGDRQRLIPYLWEQVVKEVNLEDRRMVVDWDPEF